MKQILLAILMLSGLDGSAQAQKTAEQATIDSLIMLQAGERLILFTNKAQLGLGIMVVAGVATGVITAVTLSPVVAVAGTVVALYGFGKYYFSFRYARRAGMLMRFKVQHWPKVERRKD